jgi:imidazolonepropionase-like amidohydrolase/Tol biopolymer transport system component
MRSRLPVASLLLCLAMAPLVALQGDKDTKTWDVATADLGPTHPIDFETSEGTWVNVDVSPDGRTVVFDLLGDLYTMPIEGTGGGLATRITSGQAFDMQPRFSPDGRWIAFASDRDGLTNIWLVKPDGASARQLSKEKRWYVNSPTWAPDSEYVYARRHFVKERSGGAGEVWMYHAGGGEGLQVTEKNGWQKDAGEPALSPDGRYLYYSKDITPGQSFEYDKNPYATIYGIIRRDLKTGRERTEIAEPGGSVAPRVSPDGRTLAFVRRIGAKSTLMLRTLATGDERALFDRLDRDMQEGWAIHGVYTQYGWMPDGRSLVVWGEGRIWRVDAASGEGREIPFRARVEQKAAERLVFRHDVAPDRFKVRMLRDVAVAPDGSAVVFSALGQLYRRALPSGAPSRITADPAFEFEPAWSADGRHIVYTTWTDAGAGRVRVVDAQGSGGRDLVGTPGHYTDPSFAPDGARVVFLKVGGDNIRGDVHGLDPGIYVVKTAGGEPQLVREGGTAPQFDHTGTRIYFRDRRGEKFVLASVDLAGGDERVHFQSDNATEVVPSPDGKWVAFAERYRAYVAAFPQSGRTVDLGPSVAGYPVARISRDAGMYLQWSGDSRRVHWSLGPELFTRSLERTFTFVAQDLEKPDEPEAAGVDIGFEASGDKPSGTVALVGARIVTMREPGPRGVIENGTVVVEGNRIVAVGPSGSVRVPAGAARIDVRGRTMIPGIIDAHAHVGSESNGILAEQNWRLVANLAYGVTTIMDPSNDTETIFSNAELARAGRKLAPRIYSTGTILYGAETPFKAVVESEEDARAHLRRIKAVGGIAVKSYNQQRRDARQMIVKAARDLEMMVLPEGGSLQYMDETLVHDGHTGLEHSLPVPKLYKDVVELFAQGKSGYTPTIIVGYGGLQGENYWYQKDEVWKNQRLLTFTPRAILDSRSRRRPMAADDDFNHVNVARGAKQLFDRGVLVQLGAHGQLQGLGAHWELWMLAQGGMTPLEALQCATINGARYLGWEKDLGSIETGKLADLVVLERNPLENIRNSDSVRLVMINGRVFDAATMNEVGNHPNKRPAFPWRRR